MPSHYPPNPHSMATARFHSIYHGAIPTDRKPALSRHSHNHYSIPTTTSFRRKRESRGLRPPTYSWEYPSPHKVTGCIRRMVRGSRIQIPAYAGMTWGCCGNDVMGENDVRHGPRDSRFRGNDGGGFSVWRQSAGQGILNRASMAFAWLLQTGYYRRSGVVFPTFGLLDAAPHSTRITQGGSIHDCASRGW